MILYPALLIVIGMADLVTTGTLPVDCKLPLHLLTIVLCLNMIRMWDETGHIQTVVRKSTGGKAKGPTDRIYAARRATGCS